MVEDRTVSVKKLLEQSLGKIPGHDGNYIIKIDKRIEKKFIKLYRSDRKLYNSIIKRLKDISFDKFWSESGRIHGNNDHRAAVGKIGEHIINKIDIHDQSRIFVCRFTDPHTKLQNLMLLGILPRAERSDTYGWKNVVREILNGHPGELFDEINYDADVTEDEKPTYAEFIHEIHAGFLGMLTEQEIEAKLTDGFNRIDPNITITYEQIKAIQNRNPPLLIDGHAGTGKSVIIALRIALETVAAHKNGLSKKFLLIAYNQRVVEMVRQYANVWTKALDSSIPESAYEIVTYETTLRLYRDLMKELDRDAIPDPNSIKSMSKIINFYRFEHQFFNAGFSRNKASSPEQAWHFIRGILKGNKHGWRGDELNIQDFKSINDSGSIDKKLTEGMSRDLIEELLSLYHDYERWRGDKNNSLDELDIVRLASRAVDAFKNNGHSDSLPYRTELIQMFDIIFIDEAQDLTLIEFALLNELLHQDGPPARFIVGGDPLQTINPTGFSWHALETYLYKLLERSPESERMLVSHRLTKSLVDFANVIIARRSDITKTDHELMTPSNALQNDDSSIVQVAVDLDSKEHQELLERLLTGVLGSSTGILVWARDAEERAALINADPVLKKLQDFSGDDSESEKVILHSVESVKGLEYDNVIFYRFGDLNESFTHLMDKATHSTIDKEDEYRVLYHLNRLFIAATRAKKNVFILDSQSAIDANWNNVWWKNTTNVQSSLKDLGESIEAEPSLEVAQMYLDEAENKGDLDKANSALLIARACPDSDSKSSFILRADIVRTEMEIHVNNLYGDNSPEIRRKREHLVSLYSRNGQKEKAIEMRLELGQWDEIHQEFEAGGLPRARIFNFYKLVSGLHYSDYTLQNLEIILTRHGGDLKTMTGPTKTLFRNRITKYVRECLYKLSDEGLRTLSDWNYNLTDIMEWMRPSYDPTNSKKNNTLENEVKRRLEVAFGPEKDWSKSASIKLLYMQLENPTITASKSDNFTSRLADLGDHTAGIKQLRKNIENTVDWDVCSSKTVIYDKILRAIDLGISAHDTENIRSYDLIRPRLNYFKKFKELRRVYSETPHNVKELVNLFSPSGLSTLKDNLRNEVSSEIPIFIHLGPSWAMFQNNFLDINESKQQQILNELMESIVRNKKTPQIINENADTVRMFCTLPLTTTPRFWISGVEAMRKTAADGKEFNSAILFTYLQIVDDEQVKKLDKRGKNRFAEQVYWSLEEHVLWPTFNDNFNKVSPWFISWLQGSSKVDPEFLEIINLYVLLDKFRNGETFPTDDVWRYLLSLAEKAEDPGAYAYIVDESGIKGEEIDISIHIKTFSEKVSPNEMLLAIEPHQEFDLGQLPWFAQGPISKSLVSDASVDNLDPYTHFLSGAILGLNIIGSLNWSELTDACVVEQQDEFKGLAKCLHPRIVRRCELFAREHEFWNVVTSRDEILDYVQPRRTVELIAFKTYAVVELLFILSKEDNKSRIKILRKFLIPQLSTSSKKKRVVEELFKSQLFSEVFDQEGEDFEQSKQYAIALLLGKSNPD